MLWRWRRGLFLAGLVTVAATGGLTSIVFNIDLPPAEPLLQTSFVCAADVTEACGPDNAIATFSAEEDRINVPLEELPDVLVHAVLATEDQRLLRARRRRPGRHRPRAVPGPPRAAGTRQGGSTITQQYVKNAYLTSERSITRKIKEAVLAVKLEQELDKDEILERYLNTIYFGRGAYGVEAASRAYFGKDVREIGLPEASYLAGPHPLARVRRRPGRPDRGGAPARHGARRMRQEGYITRRRARRSSARHGLGLRHPTARPARAPAASTTWQGIGAEYFIEAVRQQVAEQYGEDMLYGGGLRIYTTLDRDMQAAAWDAVTEHPRPARRPGAALVAIDDHGQVKAMVGGTDFDTQQGQPGPRHSRVAARAASPARRSSRSSWPRRSTRGSRSTRSSRLPAEIVLPRGQRRGGLERGQLRRHRAGRARPRRRHPGLVEHGLRPADARGRARSRRRPGPRLGITAELPVVNSLVLGTGEVSVLDMATGYSTFANRGVHNAPT